MSSPSIGNGVQRLSISTEDEMTSPAPNSNEASQPERHEPTFNGLPGELKKMVVDRVRDSDLPNLRLSNKELNGIAIKPFGERCLAECRFLLSRHSLQGLVELTAHPILGKSAEVDSGVHRANFLKGPCVQKVPFNTYSFTTRLHEWPGTKGKIMSKAECQTKWTRIQSLSDQTMMLFSSRDIFNLLGQAISNLKKHTHKVTFGVYDDVLNRGTAREILRKGYGLDKFWGNISPLADFGIRQCAPTSGPIFGVLEVAINAKAPTAPIELNLALSMRTIHGANSVLDQRLINYVVTVDGTLRRDVNICIKVALDWTFRFFHLESNNDHHVFDYRGKLA